MKKKLYLIIVLLILTVMFANTNYVLARVDFDGGGGSGSSETCGNTKYSGITVSLGVTYDCTLEYTTDYDYFIFTASTTGDYFVNTTSDIWLDINIYTYSTNYWLYSFEAHNHGGTIPLETGQKVYIRINSRDMIADDFSFELIKVNYSNEPDLYYILSQNNPWSLYVNDGDGTYSIFRITGEDNFYTKYEYVYNSSYFIFLNGGTETGIGYYFFSSQLELTYLNGLYFYVIKPGEEPYYSASTIIEGIDFQSLY